MSSSILQDFESVLTALIINSRELACTLSNCNQAHQMGTCVAEAVIDSLSYEFGGNQIYLALKKSQVVNGELSATAKLCEDFIATLGALLDEKLTTNRPLEACKSCNILRGAPETAVMEILEGFYATYAGMQFHLPFARDRQNRLIAQEFTGNNVRELIKKYRVSSSTVYTAIAKYRKAKNERRTAL